VKEVQNEEKKGSNLVIEKSPIGRSAQRSNNCPSIGGQSKILYDSSSGNSEFSSSEENFGSDNFDSSDSSLSDRRFPRFSNQSLVNQKSSQKNLILKISKKPQAFSYP
jgi:hypothetical protein